MTDNQLLTLIVAGLEAGLATAGVADVLVAQNYQPTQQGADSGMGLYVHKVGDVRRGSPRRWDALNDDRTEFVHHELQQMETTFQVSALSPQVPTEPTRPTASDLANLAAAILGSDAFMDRLRPFNVGVLRIAQVTNPQAVNDYDQNEAEPTLDFVLTHKREFVNGVPVVVSIEINIHRV